MTLLVLSGCRPIPPIAKVGLLAPFEGLYRESGYAALDALRAALAECAPREMALVPLALDSGSSPEQARRAAAKLALDPALAAVIGPLDLASAAAAADVLEAQNLPWIVPALVSPDGGYASPSTAASVGALVEAAAQSQPAPARLLVVGLPPAWQDTGAAGRTDAMPLLPVESTAALLDAIQPGDGVLWLGAADEAAEVQNQLAAAGRTVTIWLGPAVAGTVFAAHATPTPGVYRFVWQGAANTPAPYIPSDAYIESMTVYWAACAALAALETGTLPDQPLWQLHTYRLDADGTWAALD